ncbi:MAG: hypothetical protein OXC53_06450 [Rhodobacteraceae bacterium]|nr:hypothetical protein [Paracoccaceae bacterium]
MNIMTHPRALAAGLLVLCVAGCGGSGGGLIEISPGPSAVELSDDLEELAADLATLAGDGTSADSALMTALDAQMRVTEPGSAGALLGVSANLASTAATILDAQTELEETLREIRTLRKEAQDLHDISSALDAEEKVLRTAIAAADAAIEQAETILEDDGQLDRIVSAFTDTAADDDNSPEARALAYARAVDAELTALVGTRAPLAGTLTDAADIFVADDTTIFGKGSSLPNGAIRLENRDMDGFRLPTDVSLAQTLHGATGVDSGIEGIQAVCNNPGGNCPAVAADTPIPADSGWEFRHVAPGDAGRFYVRRVSTYAPVAYVEWGLWTKGLSAVDLHRYVGIGRHSIDLVAGDLTTPANDTLAARATYSGQAQGLATRRTVTNGVPSVTESGHFTADVALTATFGAAAELDGRVSNFTGGIANPDWVISFQDAGLADGTVLLEGDAVIGDVNGRFSAQSYGTAGDARPTGFFGAFENSFADGSAGGVYHAAPTDPPVR